MAVRAPTAISKTRLVSISVSSPGNRSSGNYYPPVADPNGRQSYFYNYPKRFPCFAHALRAKGRGDFVRTQSNSGSQAHTVWQDCTPMKLAGYREWMTESPFLTELWKGCRPFCQNCCALCGLIKARIRIGKCMACARDEHLLKQNPAITFLICFFASSFHPISSLTVIKFWAIG